MNTSMINGHIHIFVSECAPGKYLRVKSSKLVKKLALPIKVIIESAQIRRFIHWLERNKYLLFRGKRRKEISQYISFLNIGTQLNQKEVFEYSYNIAKIFDTNPRLITMTLDLDYMDTNSKPIVGYDTQWYEVCKIKELYPDNIFPFISVDPRARSGHEIVQWIDKYFNTGVRSYQSNEILPYASGIKLYPAHGHFPFDPRLDNLYKYCEENSIPLMFHCTRVGSQYIGREIESIIPRRPEMIMPPQTKANYKDAITAKNEILKRIELYYNKDWIKNSPIGENEFSCDLLSHPQNYVPIMCKYPKLKICLAHMGGGDEIKYMHLRKSQWNIDYVQDKQLIDVWKTDKYNWGSLIMELMKNYECLYTDISSTISHIDQEPYLTNIKNWLDATMNDDNSLKLGERVLFGTDFYMTEFEREESELYSVIRGVLGNWWPKMSGANFNNYLKKI